MEFKCSWNEINSQSAILITKCIELKLNVSNENSGYHLMHAALQFTTHKRPIFIPFFLSYSLLCRSHTSLDQLIFEPFVSVWVMQRLNPQCARHTHTLYQLCWSHLIGSVGHRIPAQEKWHNKTIEPINPHNCDRFNDYFVSILFYWRSQTHRVYKNNINSNKMLLCHRRQIFIK